LAQGPKRNTIDERRLDKARCQAEKEVVALLAGFEEAGVLGRGLNLVEAMVSQRGSD